MSFPNTRHTLIQRLVQGGGDADWREFLQDYWGPVCRFARHRGNLSSEDAEDVASQALEAIVRNRLLSRWATTQSARLRTLICAVVRNVLSNRGRVEGGRARIIRDHAGQLDRYLDAATLEAGESTEHRDAFYAAWAEDILQSAVEGLLEECNRSGKGDQFRVLYGRLCEQMSMAEIAESLDIKASAAESWFRQMRDRLSARLEEIVRGHVERYSTADNVDAEFVREWSLLGDYLQQHGGLEETVRRSYADFEPSRRRRWTTKVAVTA